MSYEVFRSENGGGYALLKVINKTSLDEKLQSNISYRYYVIAFNACGEGDHSNEQSMTGK
jgi:hypothetical protein